MDWIKITRDNLPKQKTRIHFMQSASYGGGSIETVRTGYYVPNYSNEYVGPKPLFIGDDKSAFDVHNISHYALITLP